MITKGKWDNFLTLERERLLLVKRKHIFVLILPLFINFSLFTIFIIGVYYLFLYSLSSIPLFIVNTLVLISISLGITISTILSWYYHIYILTNRKLLEIWYTPFSSRVINDVLLDRVNCTEIDLRTNGLFNEMIDMGDVAITFDRPTKQEEFILKDIEDCYKIGTYLTQQLMQGRSQKDVKTIWLRDHHNTV